MSRRIIFSLFGADKIAKSICKKNNYELGKFIQHQFPDSETLIKINSNILHKEVIIVAFLDQPNCKILPLIFFAETARRFGAKKIVLVTPYLPYMRQDKSFHPNEGITCEYFAKIISTYFNKIITIDPHLHRFHSLDKIYSIPTQLIHSTKPIAYWLIKNVKNPILIGPDAESKQWVSEIAKIVKSPFVILKKTRSGDRSVSVTLPDLKLYRHCSPILIDDIISTGISMIKTIKKLKLYKMKSPICIGVHGLFVENAYQKLKVAGAKKIVTCNTVPHISNKIDVTNVITFSKK